MKLRLWNNLTIRLKLMISFVFLFLLLLGVVVFSSTRLSGNLLTGSVLRLAEDNVAFTAQEIEALLMEPVGDIRFLVDLPPVLGIVRATDNNGVDPVDESTYLQWTNRLQTIFKEMMTVNSNYAQLRYIDENGNEIVRVDQKGGEINAVAVNGLQYKGDRYYFLNTIKLKKGETYVSPIDLNREGALVEIERPFNPMVRYAQPVFDENANSRGIVIINVSYQDFFNRLREINLNEAGEIGIVNSKGFHLLNSDRIKEWGGESDLNTNERLQKDFPELSSRILSGETDFLEANGNFYVYRPVFFMSHSDDFWVIIKTIPKDVILADVNFLRNQLFLLGGTIIFLALIFINVLSGMITKPIQNLTHVAQKIASGDITSRADVSSNDEVGQLAGAFNDMADNLVRSLTKTRKTLDTVPDALFVLDVEGNVTSVNPKALAMLGIAEKDIIGRPIDEFIR